MTLAAGVVQDRQPRFTARIQPPWRNLLQRAGRRLAAILGVHVQEFLHRRFTRRDGGQGGGPRLAHTPEAMREGVTDARQSFGAQTGHRLQPPVVRRALEIFQRLEAELVVQFPCEGLPDAGDRRQQRNRIVVAAQPVEHREPAVEQDVADRAGNARADAGQLLQTGQALRAENCGHRLRQPAQDRRRLMISLHAKAVGTLLGEDARHFIEASGDIFV